MKFTLTWLYEHLETNASLAEICDTLNMIGLEVENVSDPAARLAGFEVAEIIAINPHPNADKLQLCTVKTLAGTQEIVCGAANARKGLKSIFAPIGAAIPANGMILRKAKIRGVESCGMLCSAAELELGEDADGIIELPAEIEIGTPAATALGRADPIIDIAITPNRPDCLGVRGIARDLAAAGLGTLKTDSIATDDMDFAGDFNCPISIGVETKHCPAFAACVVRGVKNTKSPAWLADRLTAIGLSPINALVDITNYIAYDYGRPLHVYDMAKLNGSVVARAGKAGERFVALNNKEYKVTIDDCVIADTRQVLGFGGIMGGLDSGTTLDSTDILVESAWFEPVAIANTGRRHNIESDARTRFERGVDPQSVAMGLNLAVQMILKICGGQASKPTLAGTIDAGTKQIMFDPARVQALTGVELTSDAISTILRQLGCVVEKGKKGALLITRPSWRPDIENQADLVEEIIRIHGLDKVPSVPLPASSDSPASSAMPATMRSVLPLTQNRLSLARRLLANRGMVEAVTWSFIPEKYAHFFGCHEGLKLANPVSNEMSHMRPSLLPGLLQAVARNADRGFTDLALFEAGQEFTAPAPDGQRQLVAGLRCGNRTPRHWAKPVEAVDIFDAKADVEALLSAYGLALASVSVKRDVPNWYHPGRAARLCQNPRTPLAIFGEVHPAILEAFDLPMPVIAFELYLDNLSPAKKANKLTPPPFIVSNRLALRRDFAFEVAQNVTSAVLIRAAYEADKKYISHVSLFDAFTSEQMGEGVKSLAIEVTLQPQDANLTDAQIEDISARIIAKVEAATGGKLRQ